MSTQTTNLKLTQPQLSNAISNTIPALSTDMQTIDTEFGQRGANVMSPVYGAKGDGTTDDTAAIQAAHDAISSAGGGVIYFPPGTYITSGINISSNMTLVGSGVASILKKKSGSSYAVSINAGSGGTTNPANNITDVKFINLQFRGTSDTDGFSQYQYLLNLNAASSVLVEGCKFVGFNGDGVYIGSSNVASTERHNQRICILNCEFDGLNNQNRNAISVVDCDGLIIEGNKFRNCTSSTMPGAIDIEPNGGSLYAVIRDITIKNNRFENVGGNIGVISMTLHDPQANLTNPSVGIFIEDNYINGVLNAGGRSNGISLSQYQDAGDNTQANNIIIRNNIVRQTNHAFQLFGLRGVKLQGNIFEDGQNVCYVSYNGSSHPDDCCDIEFSQNIFRTLSNVDGTGIEVFDVTRISFFQNVFDNCGKSDGSFGNGIDFNGGDATPYHTQYVRIEGNTFKGPNTHVPVQFESSAKTNAATNRVTGNTFNGTAGTFMQLPSNTFTDQKAISYGTSAPTTGTYNQSDLVYNKSAAASGNIGWVCTTAGQACNTAWAASTAYSVNNLVYANGNVYQCTTAGTSGTTAPSGTGSSITDGTVVWSYVNTLAVFKTFGTISA